MDCRRAQDRPAQRLAVEGRGLGQFEHQVVGRVGRLGDLLADHLLLAGEVAGVQGRAQHQVGDHRHAPEARPPAQRAHLEAGALIAGGGVDLAALGLDHLDDVAAPSARRRP